VLDTRRADHLDHSRWVAAVQIAAERRWLGTLLQPFPDRRRKTVRAAVADAAAFPAWRSLCVDQGLSNGSAVDLMAGMVAVACESDEFRPDR